MTVIVKWNTVDDTWNDIEVASKGSCLLQQGDTIYTLDNDNSLERLEYNLSELTKTIFEDEGFGGMSSLPDLENIFDLKLLSISDNVPKVSTEVMPHPQLILSGKDILLKMASKIIGFKVTANHTVESNLKIVFSVDSGEIWKSYDANLMQLEDISDIENLEEISTKGMTVSTFNSMGAKWESIVKDGRIKFGYYLDIDEIDDVAEIDKLEVTIETTGRWRKSKKVRDYDYDYNNETLSVSLYNDGSYKINYTE